MPRSYARRQGRRLSTLLRRAVRLSAFAVLLLPGALSYAADTRVEATSIETARIEAARIEATRTALQAAALRSASLAKPPTIAREQLLRHGAISNVHLSPDGRYLLFRQRGEQQTDLWLQDLTSNRRTRVLADIRRLDSLWSADSKLIWLADDQGLAVFDLGTSAARRIVKWDDRRKQRFLTVDRNAAGYAVISEKLAAMRKDNSKTDSGDASERWLYRYLRVDASGKSTLLLETQQPLRDVLLTEHAELAYTATYDGPQYDTVIRRHEGNNSHELLRCIGIERCRLVGYNRAQQTLWLLSHHGEDTMALQQWQASSNRWQTLHRDPAGIADASTLLWQAGKQDWLAVAYNPDRRHWYGNGAQVQAQLAALAQQLPEANLQLASAADGKRWLVLATNASWQQDRYYLYAPERQILQPLFEEQRRSEPLTPAAQLATALPISYRATDGMLIHGYVYLPNGVSAAKAPLIANLHGGPYNRNRDDYDAIVQLLVNRGYTVFSPNFRASTGYGQRYLHAANADFGNGKVLSDIIDGLDFLLAQGIGDRNKQAVIGHSFGGYASLLAVSHHPSRFRFAVASAGPAEFGWGMKWIANNGGSAIPEDGPPAEIFFAHYGVHLADTAWRQKMQRESPLQLLPQLQAPLYLWAGGRDDRVPLKEISHYAGEAKRYGKPLSLLIDPDSGHNPGAALNLEALVYLIERAAALHFAGAVTPPSEPLKRFVAKNLRIDGNGVGALSK